MFRFIDQLGAIIAVPQSGESSRRVSPTARDSVDPPRGSSSLVPNCHLADGPIQRIDSTELTTHLNALRERSGPGILIVDRDGLILEANPRAWTILPTLEDSSGSTLQAYMAASGRGKLQEFLNRQFEQPTASQPLHPHDSIELALHGEAESSGRSRWLKIEIVSRSSQTLALAVEDVTQVHQLNQEKQNFQEQLRHIQRLELVNEWSAGMAHDFNNLLQVIESYGAVIAHEAGNHEPVCQAVEEILEAARRGSTLVKRLLAFSRKSTLQFTRCNVVDLVAHCAAVYRHALASHVTIEHRHTDEPVYCTVDQTLIEQAVLNLCVNARDAMPGGGQIVMEVQTVRLNDMHIQDACLKAGRYALIRVSDSGVGIPSEMKQKIFEPFFTTKKVGAGTGLGLSLVRGIAWDHSGAVDVDSTVGQGSTFTLYLPMQQP